MMILATLLTVIAVSAIVSMFAPMTADRIVKWWQIIFMCPRAGELAQFIEPSPSGMEGLAYTISRMMFPDNRVPFGALVVVVEHEGDHAVVLWDGKLARLPRRWLRKPEACNPGGTVVLSGYGKTR